MSSEPAQLMTEAPKPIVLTPLVWKGKYNIARQRIGRGFSIGELKEAGISKEQAMLLGVYIDVRRKSVYKENIDALKRFLEAYKEGKVLVVSRKKLRDSSPQSGRVFRGLTHAGKKSRGIVKSRYKESHKRKWKMARKPRKTPSMYYHG
ncbi:MAG: ribosomal protein L13e [Thermoprotei archaeon]